MRTLTFACLTLTALAVTLCGRPARAAGTLTVVAASSLTEGLQDMKPVFEKAHPGVELRLSFASSSQCRMQIEQGAPADVFLSADTENMDPLVKAKLVDKPVIFAHNTLIIIVPKDNPAGIKSPGDLTKPGVKLITCAPKVPIGNYTRQVIDKMDASGEFGPDFKERVLANIVSEEPNVKGIVGKVTLGEADAAFCYVSDVTPPVKARVQTIEIPEKMNAIADYPMAVISATADRELAQAFIEFVLSREGQRILKNRGFIPARPEKPSRTPTMRPKAK